MDERKQTILDTIIKEHIKTGTPVGSGVLVEKYNLNISPATVRNVMAALEDENYITQPHTSAGRIPTEKAYRYYLSKIGDKKLHQQETDSINNAIKGQAEPDYKETAKLLSQMSGNAVFWAFHRHNVYYTGLSNLLQQPEFSQLDVIYDISAVIDRIDEIVNKIIEKLPPGVHTVLGSANPFGNMCSTIMVKYHAGERHGLFGIIGPMRMNYEKNLAMAKYVNSRIGN